MADPVPPASDLPAPYASPWGQLGGALRAVLASLRLKLRELWRRNREGDLSVPGFWPQGLAPLFWPLLLAALLTLTLALAGKAWGVLSHRAPSPPPAARPAAPLLAPATEEAPTVSAPARVAPAPVTARAPIPEPEPAPPPPPPPLELDPLLALLAQDDPEHLVASVHPEPSEGRLVLTMAPSYAALNEASRRRWAERWQQRALALGYEWLELVDGQQRLLARGALVGSGMILLDPGASG
ncbi:MULTISPECIES: hypothetical protein [unclassified Cyanobium]|uniref:hypothetical protein n=1 Tax=unclassified Cyanobium TaxID=2627006 RepID=UPI0020CDDA9D|nr:MULTISPECIES: hypothetical protein [unclassified Cyanobium]MCP9834530.1 hypothetical protein [Cyanobium sp. La Preciosa 7G6]MCP9937293.1 hypothetical protein [Cyanobium sp. Aljojuca 7A6]